MSVAKHYKGHISGWMLAISAIGLQIAAAWVSNDPTRSATVVRWSAWIMTAAAVWVVFVAQYDAWREERTRAEAEVARNLKPQIEGELLDFTAGSTHGSSIVDGKHYRHVKFSCRLVMTNRRPVTTNILGCALVGFKCSPSVAFLDTVVSPMGVEVIYAKGTLVNISGIAQIEGDGITDEVVSLDGLYAVVLDGFRDGHEIRALNGNYLVFPAATPSALADGASGEAL